MNSFGTTNFTGSVTFGAGATFVIPAPSSPEEAARIADLVTALAGAQPKRAELTIISVAGADIASASTINLEMATGESANITGAVSITAITLDSGHFRCVRFMGAPTLVNSANLVLPGGADIQTATGDFALFLGYTGDVVRCVFFQRASGDLPNLPKRDPAAIVAPPATHVAFFADESGLPKIKTSDGTIHDFVGPQGATGAKGATGASGAGAPALLTAWLSQTGDDGTGVVGDSSKPCASAQSAYDAGARVLVLLPRDDYGTYGPISVGAGLTLIGYGVTVSKLDGITVIGGSVSIEGNGLVAVGVIQDNVGVGFTVRGLEGSYATSTGAEPMDAGVVGGPGGNLIFERCSFISVATAGGRGGNAYDDGTNPANGGNGGNGGSITAHWCKGIGGTWMAQTVGGPGGSGAQGGDTGSSGAGYLTEANFCV